MRIFVFIFLILLVLPSFSQAKFGITAGVVCNLGTSIRRGGFFVAGYAANYASMLTLRLAANYNTCSWGTKQSSPEFQIGTGLVFGLKSSDTATIRQLDVATSGGYHTWAFGYAQNWYFDRLGTSQRTGTIAMQCRNVYLVTENDIFSGFKGDRYRTAAALVQYRQNASLFGLKLLLWTGDAFGPKAILVTNSSYKARFGYKDLSDEKWGKISLGILAFELGTQLPYQQVGKIAFGVDAEQIRHIFQNKFIHDSYFVPTRLIHYKDYHYPKLDNQGCPVIDSSQQVRPMRVFLNFSTNENIFY